jgi:hypothetical protein
VLSQQDFDAWLKTKAGGGAAVSYE